jgi:hypothetical protein
MDGNHRGYHRRCGDGVSSRAIRVSTVMMTMMIWYDDNNDDDDVMMIL